MNFPEKYFPSFRLFSEESDDGLTRWLKSISFLSVIISLLIFVDYFLPLKKETHEIKSLIVRSGFSDIDYDTFTKHWSETGEEEYWLILNDDELAISEENMSALKINSEIILFKTTIFGINVKAESKYINHSITPYFNVYGFLLIIPILFLVFYILMRIFSKKSEVVLSLGVLTIFMLVGFGVLLLFY